jgi:hypothetical protein
MKHEPAKESLKGKTVFPVVQASTPGPGVVMNHTPPTWTTSGNYAKKALVTLEGKVYRSKKDNNTSTPSSTSADWTFVK